MNDLPQTFMEPLLFKTACQRGTQARMSTEYVSHVEDAEGVTTTLRDRLTGKDVTVRSKYLVARMAAIRRSRRIAGCRSRGRWVSAGR